VSNSFGVMIESLVAVLLLLTIGFCIVLDRRLKKLKADEQALKATISELITATEIAERAIAGLKLTVRDTDVSLTERLRDGGQLSDHLARQIDAGNAILERLAQITVAVRPAAMPDTAHLPDAHATALAAQAFATRARARAMNAAA
jgi:uncharacterized protein DUF6468